MTEERRPLPVLGEAERWEGESDADGGSPQGAGEGRRMTPLQAELLEEGALPDPDLLGRAMLRPDLAPEAGYGDGGPRPLRGPGGRASTRRPRTAAAEGTDADVEIPVPVYQWEVDPRDQALPVEEVQARRDGWEYRMWWQEHPSGLVYASLQALRADPEEAEGSARAHPVGRAVAVNLVYDREREAIVAVYGTARDFRPFVAAFWEAYTDRDDAETAGSATEAAAPRGDREGEQAAGAPADGADESELDPNVTEAG